MANLLSSFNGLFTDGIVGKISSLIGSNSSLTKIALGKLAPSLMKGIINKGSSESGAQSLLNMIKNDNVGANKFGNLTSLLDNDSSDVLSAGSKMNSSLFGDAASSMVSGLGIGSDSSSKLMNLATPLLMNQIGGVVSKDNLDAKGLSSYLSSQKSNLVEKVGTTARSTTKEAAARVEETRSGGGGILKWLIPLFLLLAAGWFLMQNFGGDKEEVTEKTEAVTTDTKTNTEAVKTNAQTTTNTAATSTTDAVTTTTTDANAAAGEGAEGGSSDGAYFSVDADGNLVDADGNIIAKKGEFSVKDGAYYDASGKKLGVLAKIGKAIGGAATKTADAFKDVFGGMFKKKSSGEAVAAYGLSNVQFDDNNRVVNFSKNEVLGLAEALKAYPDSKIKVQVSGADKKVTKARAKVVHDWLVTLGIADKQVSAEGMGEGADKVSIVIE